MKYYYSHSILLDVINIFLMSYLFYHYPILILISLSSYFVCYVPIFIFNDIF